MSFVFPSWESAFSPAFYESAKETLETALNKGNKPPVIQGRIEVVELSMGTQPPTLTLLEIGDLSLDRFRGILRLGYQGDAWLEVRCRVQANPLSHNPNLLPSSTLPMSTPLLASQPLLVPMTLRLSKLHLRAILILVVSASKGITLVFKNDPLQNVDVSSTFDSVEVIRGYLQQEIEGQLREMFREDLPGIIHRLSQRWFTGSGVGGRVEMPYRESMDLGNMSGGLGTPGSVGRGVGEEDEYNSDPYTEKPIFPPYQPTPSFSQLTPKRRAMAQQAVRLRRPSTAQSASPSAYTIFPEIEEYDPTYGLRPEGVPTHSGYEAFGRLWEKTREGGNGLGSLMRIPVGEHEGEVSDVEEEDEEDVFLSGGADLDGLGPEAENGPGGMLSPTLGRPGTALHRRLSGRSKASSQHTQDTDGWETYPAVGGGVITRPRVYHSQSQIRAPSDIGGGAVPSPSATGGGGSVTARASSVGGASSTIGSLGRQRTGIRAAGATQLPPPPYRLPGPTSAVAGPGPSSLRRMVTSRSDVFLSRSAQTPSTAQLPSSSSYKSFAPTSRQARRQSGAPTHLSQQSSHGQTGSRSGTSWSTNDPVTRSSTFSTLPSSTSMSIPLDSSPSKTHIRTPSVSTSPFAPGSFPPRGSIIGPGGITLPMNNSVSQLAALSNSAHTLSPYARGHEHIAVRSFPHLGRGGSSATASGSRSRDGMGGGSPPGIDPGQVRGNRKRVHRMGAGATKASQPMSPTLEGDVDDYMPLGAVSPHLPEHRQLPLLSPGQRTGIGRSTFGMDSLSMHDSVPTRETSSDRPKGWRPQSMTGLATQLMRDDPGIAGPGHMRAESAFGGGRGTGLAGQARPNLMRSPDSRTSYGFPAVRRFA